MRPAAPQELVVRAALPTTLAPTNRVAVAVAPTQPTVPVTIRAPVAQVSARLAGLAAQVARATPLAAILAVEQLAAVAPVAATAAPAITIQAPALRAADLAQVAAVVAQVAAAVAVVAGQRLLLLRAAPVAVADDKQTTQSN